jgi:hypothetical protein
MEIYIVNGIPFSVCMKRKQTSVLRKCNYNIYLASKSACIKCRVQKIKSSSSSLNVFDDGAVLLQSILWALSIISMFCNHNISRGGSSLVIR